MVLTILAERRNSPSSGRPSTSSRTVWVKIALRHGGDRAGDFRRRAQQVFHQRVDRNFHLAPGAPGLMEARALARSALLSDHLADALEFLRHLLVGGDDLVEGVGDLSRQARPGARQAHGKIAVAHRLQARQDDRQISSRDIRAAIAVGVPVAFGERPWTFRIWPRRERLFQVTSLRLSKRQQAGGSTKSSR